MADDPNVMPAYTMHEQKVARTLVDILLERGYGLRVHDGEEFTSLAPERDASKIITDMGTTGTDALVTYLMPENATTRVPPVRGGITFWLIGNGAHDDETALELVSDHTDSYVAEAIWEELKRRLGLQ